MPRTSLKSNPNAPASPSERDLDRFIDADMEWWKEQIHRKELLKEIAELTEDFEAEI